jgi:parvulin-like peptidyl-prolyl isomerase
MKNFTLLLMALLATFVSAQKPQVPCDFVALINKQAISEADYLAALNEYKAELTRHFNRQGKTDPEFSDEFERTKSIVLKNMIDDLLLEQRAEELRLADDPQVKQILEDPGSIVNPGYRDEIDPVAFEQALKNQGIDPERGRQALRKGILRQAVIYKEVLEPILSRLTEEDRRTYYNMHKEEFMLPARVTLSEIFLPFNGSPETKVKQRASRLLGKLRKGADFISAYKENTPITRPSYDASGHLGSYSFDELKESIREGISDLQPGEFTHVIRSDEGYIIIRLDARIPSTFRSFSQPEVQQIIERAIVISQSKEAREIYLADLRRKARIQICSNR